VYPADQFDAAVDKVIAKLRSGPAVALRETKQAVNAATLTELDGAFARERKGQLQLLASGDFREGTKAFQQNRRPEFSDQ
ncbi:enoyl-CoA hydratase, partial [Mycolicibacterium fortuitum]